MKNIWKLSNYFFSWFWKKRGKYIILGSLLLGVCELLRASWAPALQKMDYEHYPKSFRSYDMVLDGSFLSLIFSISFLLLLFAIFEQIRSFETDSKSIYTLYLLPMKRRAVYASFLLSAAAAAALLYLLWLLLVVVAYFPIMGMYQKLAAAEVFRVTQDITETGIDVSQTNGLYLAFRRSIFLTARFPTSLWNLLPFLGSVALALTGVLFAGFYREKAWLRIFLSIACLVASLLISSLPASMQTGIVIVSWSFYERFLGAEFLLGLVGLAAAAVVQLYLVSQLEKRKSL